MVQKLVDGMLNNPKSAFKRLPDGKIVVRDDKKRGMIFNKDGSLQGFLDP